ncbi:MAG: protein-export chaperone SecB [Ignavibacteriaceae bacterium]|jgi:preprotein translocase subunit SecB|nr:protein-export chaperone SecB [Ignavibacteriaceae bacterium]
MKQNAEIQYSIRLKDIFFPKVVLTAGEELQKDVTSEISVRLQYEIGPNPTDKRVYQVVFTINVVDEKTKFDLEVQSVAYFECNNDIDDAFMNSGFIKVNSPAIAFPFVRSFINTLTTNAGFNPVILPAFNFTRSKPVEDESPDNAEI